MKNVLLSNASVRISVMSFHHELVYAVMRAWFESLVSQVLIWDDRAYGILWNTVMTDDIMSRVKRLEDPQHRVYAVLFGVINGRRELHLVPFREALEEHVSTGLNVVAVAVLDLDQIEADFGTREIPHDLFEAFMTKYNAWHNSFDWFVRVFENGHVKRENRVCQTMDDVIMWLKHQPELVNVKITPKQFADARGNVEEDFGILVRKTFDLTGLSTLRRDAFRDGAMALRAAFDDMQKTQPRSPDGETDSIGSVLAGTDSITVMMTGGAGFTLRCGDNSIIRITAPAGTPLRVVNALRTMLTAFCTGCGTEDLFGVVPGATLTESEDLNIAELVRTEGRLPTLAEVNRRVSEAVDRIEKAPAEVPVI